MISRWVALGLSATLAACSSVNSALHPDPTAIAMLAPTDGYNANGVVNFTQDGKVLLVDVRLDGLTPYSKHALHIHEKGDCRAPDASSAGGHFNPHGGVHGGPDSDSRHAGDLGNVQADRNGSVNYRIKVAAVSLGTDDDSIIGRAVIVHAHADDLRSQPSGNAGPRIACGLISKNPDSFF